MMLLYVQGQLQDSWTTLRINGEREQDLANILGVTLERLNFDVRIACEGEEPVRLDEYDWENS